MEIMESLKKVFKKQTIRSIIISVVLILLAIMIITNPDTVLNTVVVVAGVAILIDGIAHIVMYFQKSVELRTLSLEFILGIAECVLGIYFIANTAAIIIGSLIGLLLRRGMPEAISDAVMKALGLCTVIIGVQGAVAESDVILMIVSCVIGVTVGTAMDWEGHVNRFTEHVTSRYVGEGEGGRIANAFVTSCLIMNVGAMVIVGSLNAGLSADYNMLYTKSMLDFVSGIIMGSAMGIGVMGSALFTLIFQGAIVLMAESIAPFVSEDVIIHVSAVGSLLILAIGLNMLELTKFKVINYLPALIIVPILLYFI